MYKGKYLAPKRWLLLLSLLSAVMAHNWLKLAHKPLALPQPSAARSSSVSAASAHISAKTVAVAASAVWLGLATAPMTRRGLLSPAQCLLQLALLGAAVPPVRSDLPSAWLSLLDGYGSRAAAESAATAITPTWFSQYSQTDTYINLLFQAWQAKYNVVYTSPAEVSC